MELNRFLALVDGSILLNEAERVDPLQLEEKKNAWMWHFQLDFIFNVFSLFLSIFLQFHHEKVSYEHLDDAECTENKYYNKFCHFY